jgi:hypothetical protein
MDIGKRAYQAIRDRAGYRKLGKETERIGILQSTVTAWKRGDADPSGYCLKLLALAGYDIYWILTGVENFGKEK